MIFSGFRTFARVTPVRIFSYTRFYDFTITQKEMFTLKIYSRSENFLTVSDQLQNKTEANEFCFPFNLGLKLMKTNVCLAFSANAINSLIAGMKKLFPCVMCTQREREKRLEKIFHYLQEVIRKTERKCSGKREREKRKESCCEKRKLLLR